MNQPETRRIKPLIEAKRDGDRVITVNFREKNSRSKSLVRRVWNAALGPGIFAWLSLSVLACGFPALAQSQQPPDQRLTGSISGTVAGQSGRAIVGARVSLARKDQSPIQEVLSGDDGQFSFANAAPGPFQITVATADFAMKAASGILHPGETCTVPRTVLAAAPVVADARAVPSQAEAGKNQSDDQKTQRALGVVPNFFVAYGHNVVPLTRKQKFELAWKWTVDPVTFGLSGAIAGVEQAQNDYSGYGQGAQGYAKRYGAAYAGIVTGTFIGGAILPSLLKQDPRYFYKGSGSKRSRFLYAIANSVICKGDNGRWQTNYSNILGNLAAGGISNLYYPAQNRDGAVLTFENALFGIGVTAALNVVQEFLTRKPGLPDYPSAKH